jgi:uncharacterized membrane protein YfcA
MSKIFSRFSSGKNQARTKANNSFMFSHGQAYFFSDWFGSRRFSRFARIGLCTTVFLFTVVSLASANPSPVTAMAASSQSQTAWWVWPLVLLPLSFILGILHVLGGVGGASLFVPIVSAFLPIHFDFVRGAGLIIALSGSIAASPSLLRNNLASFRLALPVALIASSSSIVGAIVGLAVPAYIDETLLGATILTVVVLIFLAKRSDFPDVARPDGLSKALGIMGIYWDEALGENVNWHIHRTPSGFAAFLLVGFIAGMFGLGAGWANVPVFNLIMGAPLKLAVGTSNFLISVTDTSAAWVYINEGAVLPLIIIPSVVGMMIGSRLGAKIFARAKPRTIKWMVMGLLFFVGIRLLLKGLGIWS